MNVKNYIIRNFICILVGTYSRLVITTFANNRHLVVGHASLNRANTYTRTHPTRNVITRAFAAGNFPQLVTMLWNSFFRTVKTSQHFRTELWDESRCSFVLAYDVFKKETKCIRSQTPPRNALIYNVLPRRLFYSWRLAVHVKSWKPTDMGASTSKFKPKANKHHTYIAGTYTFLPDIVGY